MRDYVGRELMQGRRALITGGDSGIGRAVAVVFAKEGADVAIAYLSQDNDAASRIAIINTGSVNGLRGNKTLIDHSATKGAVHAFTMSLAQALMDRHIRVNCVAPGPVRTPLIPATLQADQVETFGEQTPIGG